MALETWILQANHAGISAPPAVADMMLWLENFSSEVYPESEYGRLTSYEFRNPYLLMAWHHKTLPTKFFSINASRTINRGSGYEVIGSKAWKPAVSLNKLLLLELQRLHELNTWNESVTDYFDFFYSKARVSREYLAKGPLLHDLAIRWTAYIQEQIQLWHRSINEDAFNRFIFAPSPVPQLLMDIRHLTVGIHKDVRR